MQQNIIDEHSIKYTYTYSIVPTTIYGYLQYVKIARKFMHSESSNVDVCMSP